MFVLAYNRPQGIALNHAIPLGGAWTHTAPDGMISCRIGDFGVGDALGLALQTAAQGYGAYTQYETIQNQEDVASAQQKLLDAEAALARAQAQATTTAAKSPVSSAVAAVSALNPLVIGGVVAGGLLLWLAMRRKR